MKRTIWARGLLAGALVALLLPATAMADFIKDDGSVAPFSQTASSPRSG